MPIQRQSPGRCWRHDWELKADAACRFIHNVHLSNFSASIVPVNLVVTAIGLAVLHLAHGQVKIGSAVLHTDSFAADQHRIARLDDLEPAAVIVQLLERNGS